MGRSPTNTREKLIAAAKELIWKHSYGSVSVDDICKAADVKKGSFYHYFPSKVDLALATMDEYFNEAKPVFDEVFSSGISPIERFEKLTDLIYHKQKDALEEYGQVCGCPCATLGSEMAGQEPAIREKVDEVFSRCERYYESTLRDMVAEGMLAADTDIKAKAAKIESFIMGQVMMARIQNSLEPLERDLRSGLFRMLGIKEKAEEKEMEKA